MNKGPIDGGPGVRRGERDKRETEVCYIMSQLPTKNVIIMFCKHMLIKKTDK